MVKLFIKISLSVKILAIAIPVIAIISIALIVHFNRQVSVSEGLTAYPPSEGYGKSLYILPIGQVDIATVEFARETLSDDLSSDVEILPAIEIPYFPEGRVGQVKADFLRSHVQKAKRIMKDTYRLLLITDEDLYAEGFDFIFGQAEMGGMIALVSTHRLKPFQDGGVPIEEIGDPACDELYEDRLRKLIRHELGHTFGLIHCKDKMCVMAFHPTLQDLDDGGDYFCSKCLEELGEFGVPVHAE